MDDLIQMGKLAQQASRQLAQLSTARKNEILKLVALALRQFKNEIIVENNQDLVNVNGLTDSFIDRLTLNDERIEQIAMGV